VSLTGLWSGLVAGVVIGALGRLVVPSRGHRQLGCILTVLIGIVGAAIGTAIGEASDSGSIVTFVIQVVAAAVLVAIFGASSRR
jgi:uncharacterized membrane protein YeaQ/YmgE (transglycosylase-associated protein family)